MRVQLESISINAMKSFRNHLIFFILFLSSFYAQAKLPECKSINTGYQNNCLGNFQFSDGAIYVGEFRNYTPNGIGTLTFANGIQYSGEFYAGKIHGKGIEYDVSGAVKRSGIWEYGNFVSAFTVDTYLFPFISSSNIPLTVTRPNITERERLIAEVDAERKKRLALEQQLAASQERERVSTEFDTERKKRQDLVSQSSASASLQLSDTLRTEISTSVARRIALVVGNVLNCNAK